MTNNFILSLLFALIIFFGVYKDCSENNLQSATICVEQNIIHLAGGSQPANASAWNLFQSLKQVKVYTIYQTENKKHACLGKNCFHQTAKGFTVKYCCVKRLLSILYTALFMLVLYKFAGPLPGCCKRVRIFKKYGNYATSDSNHSIL